MKSFTNKVSKKGITSILSLSILLSIPMQSLALGSSSNYLGIPAFMVGLKNTMLGFVGMTPKKTKAAKFKELMVDLKDVAVSKNGSIVLISGATLGVAGLIALLIKLAINKKNAKSSQDPQNGTPGQATNTNEGKTTNPSTTEAQKANTNPEVTPLDKKEVKTEIAKSNFSYFKPATWFQKTTKVEVKTNVNPTDKPVEKKEAKIETAKSSFSYLKPSTWSWFQSTPKKVAKTEEDAKAKAKIEEDAKAKAKTEEDAKAKAKIEEDAKAKAKIEEDAKAKAKTEKLNLPEDTTKKEAIQKEIDDKNKEKIDLEKVAKDTIEKSKEEKKN